MRTAIDEVWQRVKDTAQEYARKDGHPSPLTLRALIVKYFQEANASPWPPDVVIDMYAAELLAMIHDQKASDGTRSMRTAS